MPSPVLFQIGPVAIYWYGVLIVSGVLVATWLAAKQAQRAGDNPDHAWDAMLLCLVLGVVGARLYHVIDKWSELYAANPLDIFGLQMQGFGIYGAVAGGALGLWLYTRRHKLSFLHWADFAAPGLALAQAIGRWGNFFNQELYGQPTTLPWGIRIAAASRLPQYADLTLFPVATTRFHPTFLYESLWNLLVFGLLMAISRKVSKRLLDGDLFLLYGILYPLGRFFVEFQRPDAWRIGGVPTAQWVAIVAILFFGSVLIFRHQQGGAVAPVQEEGGAEEGVSSPRQA